MYDVLSLIIDKEKAEVNETNARHAKELFVALPFELP